MGKSILNITSIAEVEVIDNHVDEEATKKYIELSEEDKATYKTEGSCYISDGVIRKKTQLRILYMYGTEIFVNFNSDKEALDYMLEVIMPEGKYMKSHFN